MIEFTCCTHDSFYISLRFVFGIIELSLNDDATNL